MRLALDHIALAAETLEAGVAHAEAALGLPLAGGGAHALMGTHNRLLGLGDLYFEVIAIDPTAPKPPHPRWFDLDRFRGPPRLTNWICRADLRHAPPEAGRVLDVARGDLHPTQRLPDSGARLALLEIATPDPDALRAALPGFADARVRVTQGEPAFRATFDTPHGRRVLA